MGHHYIPQFYCGSWSQNGETIWVYPFDDRKPFETATRAVAAEKDLYKNPAKEAANLQATESHLARIEGLYSEAVAPFSLPRAASGYRGFLAALISFWNRRHDGAEIRHRDSRARGGPFRHQES